VRTGRIWAVVAAAVVTCIAATVALQTAGWAPQIKIAG
jgi:hypothetical protein